MVVLLSEVGDVLWGVLGWCAQGAELEEFTKAVGDDTFGFGARVPTDDRHVLVLVSKIPTNLI